MRSTGFRGTIPIVFAIVLLFAACASGPMLRHKHEYTLSPGQEFHPGLTKALLLPIDSTNEKPVKGLEVANDRITSLIVRHLESKGIQVEKADPDRFENASSDAYDTVREERKSGSAGVVSAEVDFGDLVPAVLEELETNPDLVIAVNVVMRDAVYIGARTIFWDGVRRRETTAGRMSGSGLPAASLQVSVHDPDGAAIFSGFGGLEPVFKISGREYVQRKDLFEDEQNLNEGICIAFYPYFGIEEYCAR